MTNHSSQKGPPRWHWTYTWWNIRGAIGRQLRWYCHREDTMYWRWQKCAHGAYDGPWNHD